MKINFKSRYFSRIGHNYNKEIAKKDYNIKPSNDAIENMEVKKFNHDFIKLNIVNTDIIKNKEIKEENNLSNNPVIYISIFSLGKK